MKQSVKSKTRQKPEAVAAGWQFEAIGTQWWIGFFEPVGAAELSGLRRLVRGRIERFDKTYSRFREDSLVSRIARQADEYTFPADSAALFALYEQLYSATGGAVTPLIGDILAAAGYDAGYTFQPRALRPPPRWDKMLTRRGNLLSVRQPATLDFGAAGKGYLVDLVADVLRTRGVHAFCVDAGGDMFISGPDTQRVGLEHPDNPEQVVGVAKLKNRAIAGSACNRRTWAGYHHIMNPFTLRPSVGLKAAWVVADTALLADGLATALFFVPPERLSRFTFEYLLINDQNRYRCSAGFPAELFAEGGV